MSGTLHVHKLPGRHQLPDLHALYLNQTFCDATIRVKGESSKSVTTLKAHKIVLASASPVFRQKLLSKKIKGMEFKARPAAFKIMLHFIYSGQLRFQDQDVLDLQSLFKELHMTRAVELLQEVDHSHCEACERENLIPLDDPMPGGSFLANGSVVPELESKILEDASDEDYEETVDEEQVWSDTALVMMPELILQEGGAAEDEEYSSADEDNSTGSTSQTKQSSPLKQNRYKSGPRIKSKDRDGTTKASREKNHLCSLCGKSLRGTTAYKRHLVVHSGMRPYPCDICGKDFTQKQRLVVHQRKHTGERPYLCSLCGKTFTESCKLKRHLAKVHKANKDGSELIPGQPVIKKVMPSKTKLVIKNAKRTKHRSGNNSST